VSQESEFSCRIELLCPRPHRAEAISDDAHLTTSVCLSVAYIGPKSRTERPRKTKIGIEVAMSHMTRTPLSRSKGQLYRDGDILWRPPALLVTDGTSVTNCGKPRNMPCTCTPHAAAQFQPIHALRQRRPARLTPWIFMIDRQRLALGYSVETVVHIKYVVTWTTNQSGLMTLIFDLLTLKVVSESHVTWAPLCQF